MIWVGQLPEKIAIVLGISILTGISLFACCDAMLMATPSLSIAPFTPGEGFELENLMPSTEYTHTAYLTIRNPAITDEEFRVWFTTVEDPAHLRNVILLRVTLRPIEAESAASRWTQYGPEGEVLVYEGTLDDITGSDNAFTVETLDAMFEPKQSVTFKLEIRLSENADNRYKNAKYVGNINLRKAQCETSGW